jgi:hypothetical protein
MIRATAIASRFKEIAISLAVLLVMASRLISTSVALVPGRSGGIELYKTAMLNRSRVW